MPLLIPRVPNRLETTRKPPTGAIGADDRRKRLQRADVIEASIGLEVLHLNVLQNGLHRPFFFLALLTGPTGRGEGHHIPPHEPRGKAEKRRPQNKPQNKLEVFVYGKMARKQCCQQRRKSGGLDYWW